MFKKVAFLAIAGAALASNGAYAATATNSLTVTSVITGGCTINPATMDFGPQILATGTINITTPVTINCTAAVPYTLGINGTVGARTMAGSNGGSLTYEVYTTAGHTTPIDNAGGTNVIGGTGNGANQTVNLFGQLLPQSTPPAGNFSNVSQMTVTY